MKLRLQVNGKQPAGRRKPMQADVPMPFAGDAARIRRPAAAPPRPRRQIVDDVAEDSDTESFLHADRGNRRIRRGLIPQSKAGRIAAALTALAGVLAACGGTVLAARFIATDPKFRIPSSRSIEIDGNSHVTRAQMLSVFGEDVERNIFAVPMEQRRAQLEQMPWVEHATVMRLLPNRIRVEVVERVPVAFVREGGRIGLVDANGVLLEIPPDTPGTAAYNFPVITGVKASEPLEERVEQMRLYAAFLKDIDSDGKHTSALLSEVDLSNPEDARALIPDHDAEILVHFGKEHFLERYRRYQEHIAEWRSQYPRLSNVDMRYERQVVLQMPPKDATVSAAAIAPAGEKGLNDGVVARARVTPIKRVPASPSMQKPLTGANHLNVSLAEKHAAPVKVLTSAATGEMDAAMRKRVDAIEARMAERQKARSAAQPKSSTTPGQ